MGLRSFQAEVLAWSQATFQEETPESKYEHLKLEVAELGENLADASEMADCLILLAGIAEMHGVDLLEEAEKKLSINKGRSWSGPDDSGIHSHL